MSEPIEDPHDAPTVVGLRAPDAQKARPDEPPVPGWDRYETLELLGQGGMGRVYRARDRRLDRPVALKLIRGDDPELLQRFLYEAQAQARVDHPNVCRVYEAGSVDGRPYIAMQLLEGQDLKQAARGLSLEQKLVVLADVAEGLHAAHRQGLIHRDVKPANVMVTRTPEGLVHPYVLDFGLARAAQADGFTRTGATVGTPEYMSPEQALGRVHDIDRRSDVYSLGVTLYELLTGKTPYPGGSALEVLHRVLHEEPIPVRSILPSVPEDLATIVGTCLEKDPDRRYGSARDLALDLRRFLDGEPIAARKPSLAYRVARRARKNRALVALSVASALALTVLGAMLVRTRIEGVRRAELAQRLGQDVKELEGLMRSVAHTLPLHDVEREREVVRRRMAEIERVAKAAGPVGDGPGHYALGRGHLALSRHEDARRELQAALDAGYRTPDVSVALGEALRWLLWEGQIRMSTLGERAQRDAYAATLEKDLRLPALAHLRAGAGTWTVTPTLVKAEIAHLERDHARAKELALAAVAEVPWLYEALALAGESLTILAGEASRKGHTSEAAGLYAEGEDAFRRALEIARSYPVAHRGLCQLYSNAMLEGQLEGQDLLPRFAAASSACTAAITADPRDSASQLLYSDIHWQLGEYQAGHGIDPTATLALSIAAAERTLQASYDPAYTLDNIGLAHAITADWAQRHGGDPVPSFTKAADALGKAIAGAPGFFSAHNNLGIVYASWGQHELERGRDPEPYWGRAQRLFDRSVDLQPKSVAALSSAADYLLLRIRRQESLGGSATELRAKALGLVRRGLEVNPSLARLRSQEKELAAPPGRAPR